MKNWIELDQHEYDHVWKLFDNRFNFKPKPSVSPDD